MLAQIQQEFPADVRIVYRHFPLISIHDKAFLAAEAAEAAGAQGRFWEMHDRLFEDFAAWTPLTPEQFRRQLETYAADLGLDVAQFAADLDQGRFTARVQEAYNAAALIPLPGTPFILFNGAPYQGPTEHWAFATLVKLEQLKDRQFREPPPDIINPFGAYTATLKTAQGDIVLALFAEQTPLTVNNFVFLAQAGWLDGITFHRVQPGFILQSGDPSGTGYGGPGYFIPDEIVPEFKVEGGGWVGMANVGPNTNGSQFFITLPPTTEVEAQAIRDLTGKYTIFGRVVAGLEVMARLTPRDPQANPEAPPGDAITSVVITQAP